MTEKNQIKGKKISLYLNPTQLKALDNRIEEILHTNGLTHKKSVSVSMVVQKHLEAAYDLPLNIVMVNS